MFGRSSVASGIGTFKKQSNKMEQRQEVTWVMTHAGKTGSAIRVS